jgi:heat shock protein HslJ
MTHPPSRVLALSIALPLMLSLAACMVVPETSSGDARGTGAVESLLRSGEWVVEDIGGAGIVDRSRVTLRFGDDGRVAGTASCNRYSGAYELTGEGLALGRMLTTKMACAPALMQQEQRFLGLLAQVRRFEIMADGALMLIAGDGRRIVARRD